jgi:hypothetical protein
MPQPDALEAALVDTLIPLLRGIGDVCVVGDLSPDARGRLEQQIGGRLSMADASATAPPPCDAVVLLDLDRVELSQVPIKPGGLLVAAVENAGYARELIAMVRGQAPIPGAATRQSICRRLEGAGWEVQDTTSVFLPFALLPFDPTRVPKTVLTRLYDWHPDIETARFVVAARRPPGRPPHVWLAPAVVAEPTAGIDHAWKTEAELVRDLDLAARKREYDEEQLRNTIAERQNTIHELRQDLQRGAAALEAERGEHARTRGLYEEVRAQLDRMESSVAWRWIVRARTTRERLLPPGTWRGRLWERLRGAVRALMR